MCYVLNSLDVESVVAVLLDHRCKVKLSFHMGSRDMVDWRCYSTHCYHRHYMGTHRELHVPAALFKG